MQRHSRLQSQRQVPPCLWISICTNTRLLLRRILTVTKSPGETAPPVSRRLNAEGQPVVFSVIPKTSHLSSEKAPLVPGKGWRSIYVSPLCVFSFRWDRGGTAVLPTSGGRVSVRRGVLTIGQTWSGDIGDYTCTVTSPAGNDSRTARLEVM